MPFRTVVCLKQVPHPEHFGRISLDPVRQTINREGVPAVMNPLDRNALEEGLRLRDTLSGTVTVLSMGPPQAKTALEEALAMGADDAVLLCDRAFAGADSLATAYSLACCLRKIGKFDLVLCGNATIDSGTGQVGPQLAELLDLPHASYVKHIEAEGEESLIVHRMIEQGLLKMRIRLPALLSVTREINRPRLPTVWGIMEAGTKELKVWGAVDVGAVPEKTGLSGSPTRVTGMLPGRGNRQSQVLEGPPAEIVKKALAMLHQMQAL